MPKSDPYHPHSRPLLIVISGPSGVGKDVTIRGLENLGYSFSFVVTATSRPKRPGEVEGRDYFFVSRQQFEEMIARNELLEHAVVYGEYKGIPRAQVRDALASGLDVVMRVDVQGAATIRRLVSGAIHIFLIPGSEEELANRLKSRSTQSADTLHQRLEMLRNEMAQIRRIRLRGGQPRQLPGCHSAANPRHCHRREKPRSPTRGPLPAR